MGRNEERGRDRDRRAKQSEPRREDLEATVKRQGDELQDLRVQLQRTSKLTVFTARDMGEGKAALQIAVFLTGLFREHMQGILKTYQVARDQARGRCQLDRSHQGGALESPALQRDDQVSGRICGSCCRQMSRNCRLPGRPGRACRRKHKQSTAGGCPMGLDRDVFRVRPRKRDEGLVGL